MLKSTPSWKKYTTASGGGVGDLYDSWALTLPSLMIQLIGLNHSWRCFFSIMVFFTWFLVGFYVFFRVFLSFFCCYVIKPTIKLINLNMVKNAIFKTSGPMFLQLFWGLLIIVCHYSWLSPTIGPICITQVYCIQQKEPCSHRANCAVHRLFSAFCVMQFATCNVRSAIWDVQCDMWSL